MTLALHKPQEANIPDFLDTLAGARRIPEISAPDDWRGEERIRNVARAHRSENSTLVQLANPQRPHQKAPIKTCAAPGCDKRLERRNVTGYCQAHHGLHKRGKQQAQGATRGRSCRISARRP